MKPIVVVQARTSSSRLPAKVLLDFHGLPISILVAKRAASTGLRVVIAISDDASDDALASIAKKHNVSVDDLKKWNGLTSNVINKGQQLLLAEGKQRIEFEKTSKAFQIYFIHSNKNNLFLVTWSLST